MTTTYTVTIESQDEISDEAGGQPTRIAVIRPDRPLISITFTKEDILSMAEEEEIDPEVALDRAWEWAKHIEETASGICSEQLANVVNYNQP